MKKKIKNVSASEEKLVKKKIYRLNKYQKLWIDTLLSGKTRKCKDSLSSLDGKSNCCLGVAIKVCGLEKLPSLTERSKSYLSENCSEETLKDFPLTYKALKLKDESGFFSKESLKGITDDDLPIMSDLTSLNDDTKMTHAEIGKFINENREAVFK